MKQIIIITLVLFSFFNLEGQCDIIPVVEGENVLCPNGISILNTQEFATYQWYVRAWGEATAKLIENETNQNINIDESHVLSYISVEVSYDSCTIFSEEVLIDQWVFLLPVIQHTGEYAYIDNGLTYLCPEHEFSFKLLLPYTTNISWYLNGALLPGEQSATLEVTQSGYYTVSGAPEVCPDYIVPLGLEVGVEVLEKKVPVMEFDSENMKINVINEEEFIQFDWYLDGELLQSGQNAVLEIDENGVYMLIVLDNNDCESQGSISVEISSIDDSENIPTKIYPNPVQTDLIVDSRINFEQYQIYNLFGQLQQTSSFSKNIQLDELPTGNYFIILKNPSHEERYLFSKQN